MDFLVPILLPDKGARVTAGIASCILGSLEMKRQVDWGLIFYGTVQRMVSGLGGTKHSCLTPFLYDLYKFEGCLSKDEESFYKATQVAEQYGVNEDEEEQSGSDSGESGSGAGPLEPAPAAEVTPESKKTKRKQAHRTFEISR